MNKAYIALFNARDNALARGVAINHNLSDGGLEMKVEDIGFKKTLEYIKGL